MSRTPTPLSPGAIVNTLATVAAKGKPQSVFLKEASPCADGVFGKHSSFLAVLARGQPDLRWLSHLYWTGQVSGWLEPLDLNRYIAPGQVSRAKRLTLD